MSQYPDLPEKGSPYAPTEYPTSQLDAPQLQNIDQDSPRLASASDFPPREREPTGHSVIDWSSFVEEDGRTYQGHTPGDYLLPNDGEEQDRLDLQHAMCLLLLNGKLALAPIVNPKEVLDIGTGTGLWATDFAIENPNSHVVGTDLCNIQPQRDIPNCEFWVENSETQDWVFPYTIDYVHLRGTLSSFNDTRTVIRRAFNHMTPGGWIEFQDGTWDVESPDGTFHGTALERWMRNVVQGGELVGRDMNRAKYYKTYLLLEGFVDVVEKIIFVPGNPWPRGSRQKKIGYFMVEDISNMIESFRKYQIAVGLSAAEIIELEAQAKREARDTSIHWAMPMWVIYGRKPYLGEVSNKDVSSQ